MDFWCSELESASEHSKPVVLWMPKWNDFTELREKVVELSFGCEHRLVNTFDREELRNLYRLADVFVQITTYEGNSFAVLEALACGTPVVSIAVGLFWLWPAIPDSRTGVCVHPSPISVWGGIWSVLRHREAFAPREWMKEEANLLKLSLGSGEYFLWQN